MKHIVFDPAIGEVMVRGRDGRDHSEADLAAAERAAKAGDETARALLASLESPTDIDVDAWMRQIIHDCPQCRAAIAAGEQPVITGPAQLAALLGPRAGGRVFPKRTRWRELKRGRR